MKNVLLKSILFFFPFLIGTNAYGNVHIPSKMKFADMQLIITKSARSRIQEKIDNLIRSKKYFDELLERVNLFLPIVERILKEEGIPDDFKYQAIQESRFISDAVHASATVGFWQFKHPTALEVGLKIDNSVDERMHIVESTRGAARYLKINNSYLDNWLGTLLAYNRGRGCVEKMGYKNHSGAKHMKIDHHTHWYIIHFIAHKLVFESELAPREQSPTLYLHEYKDGHGKTLGEIAKKFNIEEQQLKEYNKWTKGARVPNDKKYSTIIPLTTQLAEQQKITAPTIVIAEPLPPSSPSPTSPKVDYVQCHNKSTSYPIITTRKKKNAEITLINGLLGTKAQQGDTIESLADAAIISVSSFLAFNEIDTDHIIVPGQVYYYESKRRSAETRYHIVQKGETWWSISQRYGIRVESLMTKNREHDITTPLATGRVLWMRFIRPAKVPIAYETQQ